MRMPLRMFDSVDENELPPDADAYAGYIDGNWPNYEHVQAQHPNARTVSIAVDHSHDADCLDIEQSDATNAESAAWVKRQWARGLRRPILYTSVSNWKQLDADLRAAGIKRRPYGKSYHRWSAHYTMSPHRCGRSHGMPGWFKAGATQWTNKALGRNLDESQCGRSFFRA